MKTIKNITNAYLLIRSFVEGNTLTFKLYGKAGIDNTLNIDDG